MTDDELGVIERDCGPGPASTHWDGCHRSHPRCAVAALVGEVRRLRGELEWLRGEEATAAERVARVPPFDLVRLRAIASPTEGAVRAAVAAEREWAAGVADAEAAVWRSMGASGLTSWDIGSVLVELAAAIRRGPEPTTEGV